MRFLNEHCSLISVNEPKELEGFNCGYLGIDEFSLIQKFRDFDWKLFEPLFIKYEDIGQYGMVIYSNIFRLKIESAEDGRNEVALLFLICSQNLYTDLDS